MKNLLRRGLPVLLLALACVYTYRLELSETHTYPAAGINTLSAATQNGGITVASVSDTVITVYLTKYAYGNDSADAANAITSIVYSDAVVGSELQVKADMPSGPRPYGANLDITVPANTGLALATTNGAISVANTVGDLSASTTNGAIELVGTGGAASLSTTNGAIDVKVHHGGVEGSTTNGAVDCDVAELGTTEGVTLGTSNGAVTLLLPADVSATIDATNTNSSITIVDFTNVTYEVQRQHHVRARIGSGAASVTITTTNGAITVRARS